MTATEAKPVNPDFPGCCYPLSGNDLEKNRNYDYGFRDYSPVAMRFTTVDPIKDSFNWYAYVGNDPINFIDPFGLTVESYDTSNKMNDRNWRANDYGVSNPRTGETMGNVGCDATATINIANGISGNSTTPGDISDNAMYINKGNTYHNKILQGETGNSDLKFQSTSNTSSNPNAVVNKLVDMENSSNSYYVKGVATIEYGSADDRHTSRHVVQITGVNVQDNSYLRERGIPVPDVVDVTIEGTSNNDINRTYSLYGEDRANDIFKVEEIKYVELKNK